MVDRTLEPTAGSDAQWTGAPRSDDRSAVVAMAGAGQLAQMTQQAAISLGIELRILAEKETESAVLAGARTLVAETSAESLRELAEGAAVLTFDHEGFDPDLLAQLKDEGIHMAPGPEAVLFAQDKLIARENLSREGFPLPPFAVAESIEDFDAFAGEHGWPVVAKTPRGGYDGGGVFIVEDREAAADLVAKVDGVLILEPLLAIKREFAVLAARSTAGEIAIYPVVETIQKDAICHETLVPAALPDEVCAEATEIARRLVEEIGATGIVAVEFFLTEDGVLINELALRPHNSGHWTIEGCVTSQFEQHLRAVLGWPLGSTELRAPAVALVNILGPDNGVDPLERVPDLIADPDVRLHLYTKGYRPGRKLGHATVLGPDLDAARAKTLHARALLQGEPK
ncbi:MAG: 5-(carboxyamino)imidazole ribonucleotide synthase [Actinobacteria bacterium]|nr:5-(carboxyamino)imidazole ribonucleotide synthase [Actinomycetota bacterium]